MKEFHNKRGGGGGGGEGGGMRRGREDKMQITMTRLGGGSGLQVSVGSRGNKKKFNVKNFRRNTINWLRRVGLMRSSNAYWSVRLRDSLRWFQNSITIKLISGCSYWRPFLTPEFNEAFAAFHRNSPFARSSVAARSAVLMVLEFRPRSRNSHCSRKIWMSSQRFSVFFRRWRERG